MSEESIGLQMTHLPKLACLCPTYKRPQMLANALACFLAQGYPPDRCKLFILDDAGQIDPGFFMANRWQIGTTSVRYDNLSDKFNQLARIASDLFPDPDGYVIWEDDDVFLPWHLDQIGRAFNSGVRFWQPRTVFSNYAKPRGEVQIEETGGRFHSSWAYRRDLFLEVGGYPQTSRLDFDQQMGAKCRAADSDPQIWKRLPDFYPSYVYRWGSGPWNGSQAAEEGYAAFWEKLGALPCEPVTELVPAFDEETKLLYERLQKPAVAVVLWNQARPLFRKHESWSTKSSAVGKLDPSRAAEDEFSASALMTPAIWFIGNAAAIRPGDRRNGRSERCPDGTRQRAQLFVTFVLVIGNSVTYIVLGPSLR